MRARTHYLTFLRRDEGQRLFRKLSSFYCPDGDVRNVAGRFESETVVFSCGPVGLALVTVKKKQFIMNQEVDKENFIRNTIVTFVFLFLFFL